MFSKIALTIGLVLAVIAVVMINIQFTELKSTQQAVRVLRATATIRKGESPGNRLTVVAVPEEFATGLETAVTDRDQPLVANRPVATDLKEGSFLLWSHFEGGGRSTERAIMEVLSKGKRAMSIPISASTAVAGWIRPGDNVDILGTFNLTDREGGSRLSTMTIMQNMKVLAVSGKTEYSEDAIRGRQGGASDSVVFEVTPSEAELLTFALTQGGGFTLILRRPDDHTTVEIPKMNWDAFSQQVRSSTPGR